MTELDELFEALRAISARVDPVPPQVTSAARGAFAWRTVDAELAQLVYDSAADDRQLVGVRGAGPRQLTFAVGGLTVEVEVGEGHEALVGQLVPAQAGTVQVRHSDGFLTATADELGRFSVEPAPRGPVSLRCRGQGATTSVETEWVTI